MFSRVSLLEHEETGVKVAVKAIPKSNLFPCASEIDIMRDIDFPFIPSLYEVAEDEKYFYLALEYAGGGSLLDLVREAGTLDTGTMRRLCGELVATLSYLHRKGICHRDVKMENILFDEHMNVRLIDFGFATTIDSPDVHCGSGQYLSPEMVRGEKSGFESDIWSLGVVLYCCAVGRFPFYDPNYENLKKRVLHTYPCFPEHLDRDLVALIQGMLVKDCEKRITMQEIIDHPFMAEYQFMEIANLSSECKALSMGRLEEKARHRIEAMKQFSYWGVAEVSDQKRLDEVKAETGLQKIKPLSMSTKDPVKMLAKRMVHGKKKHNIC